VKDIVTSGFSLECIEDLAGFLVKALIDHIIEEEGLSDVYGILNQHLRVLLIQVGVKDSEVSHILLLGVQWVSQACQSFLEEVLGRKRGA
jgi:hypothetical protein